MTDPSKLIVRHIIACVGSVFLVTSLPLIFYVGGIIATNDIGGPLNLVIIPFGNCLLAILLTGIVFFPLSLFVEHKLKKWLSPQWFQRSMTITLTLSAVGIGLMLLAFLFVVGVSSNFIPLNNMSPILVGVFRLTSCGGIPILLGGVIYWSLLRLGDILLNRFVSRDVNEIQFRQTQTHRVKGSIHRGLQKFLLQHPDAGNIIRQTGGVRKLRWGISGKGKSGGIRVIYYWKIREDEIWFLTVYGKSERETIPGHILRKIAEEIKDV